MERLTASKLRQDIYRILDIVLETGEVIEIERKGRVVRLVAVPAAVDPPLDLATALVRRDDAVTGDIEDLDSVGWAGAWSGDS